MRDECFLFFIGILFLDEVHRLPAEGKEMFFTYMDKYTFRRMGETEMERKINALMDLVIAKNIFASANGNLIGKKDAKIVTTDTSSVDVA